MQFRSCRRCGSRSSGRSTPEIYDLHLFISAKKDTVGGYGGEKLGTKFVIHKTYALANANAIQCVSGVYSKNKAKIEYMPDLTN